MPDATLEDFQKLVGLVYEGQHPILPQPEWGQDAAYLAWWLDHHLTACDGLSVEVMRLRQAIRGLLATGHEFPCLNCGYTDKHHDGCPWVPLWAIYSEEPRWTRTTTTPNESQPSCDVSADPPTTFGPEGR